MSATANSDSVYEYLGGELELFREASRWKNYFASHLRTYLRGDVLEVGAGIGGTARVLCDGRQRSWTMLEPDARLAGRLEDELRHQPLAVSHDVRVATTADLGSEQFDCILYMDVVEHIEADRDELHRAATHLTPGGHLVVLVPAHQWLYTPFDQAIGHFRRYSRNSLRAIAPASLACRKLIYLDSIGLMASLANRLWLKSAVPTRSQIRFWDRVLVRGSQWVDPVLRHTVGKSVLGVWQRPE